METGASVPEYLQNIWNEFAALSPLQQVVLVSGLPILAAAGFVLRGLMGKSRVNHHRGRGASANRSTKVMVIDDDLALLRSIQAELQVRGFVVDAHENPEEALSVYEKVQPKLVIVDGAMFPYGGPEVLRRIRMVDRSVPVILITAFTERFGEEASLVRGFDDYVEKPLDLGVLMARVEAQLRRPDKPTGR